MGRKPKYTSEVKIETAKKYLKGKGSIMSLARDLSVYPSSIIDWIDEYKKNVEYSFQNKPKNKSYSKELKEAAIHSYLNGEGSYRTLSLKYGLTSRSILVQWVKSYNRHEPIKDYNPKGDVYMKARRKTRLEKRIEIVRRCIDHDNDYKGTSELYDVSYAQVYNWVKKYNELGEEGLFDGRGKNKDETSLTEAEKLESKIKQLEHQLELKERESIVVKKLMEVERRQSSLGRGKKRNI